MYRTILIILGCWFGFSLSAAPLQALTGPQVKQLIAGKLALISHANEHIYGTDISTFNNNLAISYFSDGTLTGVFTGSGDDHNSAVRMDTGQWWIEKNQQCYRWTHWQHNKKVCMSWNQTKDNYVLLYGADNLAGIIQKDHLI